MIIRRLKETNKVELADYDENAVEEVLQQLDAFDNAQNEDASNINSKDNKYNVRNYEYVDDDSVDSFDSDFKNTDVGKVDLDPKAADYLPALR